MQKLLLRTALAKRQAERRAARRQVVRAKEDRVIARQNQSQINELVRRDTKAERQMRREDWFLGHLAPRRDVGAAAEHYGALDPLQLRGVEKPAWKDWGIEAGDRVVVVKRGHKDEGKIGTVKDVMEKREQCTVEGLNRAYLAVPDYMLIKEADKNPIRPYEIPFSLSDVRLVAKLPSPDTGVYRDVVINELEIVKEHWGYRRGKIPRERFIAGLLPRTKIPWPEKPEIEYEDNDCDSLRIEVEDRTWTPTLREPPMPGSIVDELRNKYGKFRTRHDEEYIEKLESKERQEALRRRLLAARAVSPLKELHKKERAEKRALGKPELSEDALARIGEVMEKKLDISKGS